MKSIYAYCKANQQLAFWQGCTRCLEYLRFTSIIPLGALEHSSDLTFELFYIQRYCTPIILYIIMSKSLMWYFSFLPWFPSVLQLISYLLHPMDFPYPITFGYMIHNISSSLLTHLHFHSISFSISLFPFLSFQIRLPAIQPALQCSTSLPSRLYTENCRKRCPQAWRACFPAA